MAKGEISQKIEGVPIRRSRPVPLKVVRMGFEPLINVLKGLIARGELPMTANYPQCAFKE